VFVLPSIVTAARRQGLKDLARSTSPGEAFSQVDAVIDLLAESTAPAAQPGARKLLQQLSTTPWRLIRGAHRSPHDLTLHVTVEIAGTRYHLRLDRNLCVFDITRVLGDQTQRPAGHEPWVGPGA
jgi:hypothetical protein